MGALHQIFDEDFHFETEFFQIPSVKWETALNTKVANFVYEYDNPDNMVIVYYAGHGYVGHETRQLKLSAYVEPNSFCDHPTWLIPDWPFGIGWLNKIDAVTNDPDIAESTAPIVMVTQPPSSMTFLATFAWLVVTSFLYLTAVMPRKHLLENTRGNQNLNS